jgi:hypothetical protein
MLPRCCPTARVTCARIASGNAKDSSFLSRGAHAHNLCEELNLRVATQSLHIEEIMPGLNHRKSATVSLVQDQDIELVDDNESDLTITVIGHAELDGTKHVTDILASNSFCKNSRYLQPIIDLSDDATEITLGGELKRSASNKNGQDEGENREGLLVVLAHLHGLKEERMEELGLYNISVLGVWYGIAYTERDQSGSAKSTLQQWFAKWYATLASSSWRICRYVVSVLDLF